MTPAERQRAYRQRHGVGLTRGPAPSAPCGTVAAYKRHLRRQEATCGACRAAWAEWHRKRYEQARERQTGT